MPYLILKDYFATIQDVNLQQVLTNEDEHRLIKQGTALAEIKSYLTQKYDVSDEFRETIPFTFTGQYKAKQLIYLDATAYSASGTYALNAMSLNGGNVYRCTTAIVAPEAFTIAHWTLIEAQYTLYYIPTPYPEFNYKTFYNVGDFVWYKDSVYKCLHASATNTQRSNLQYESYADVPYTNQFPGIKVDQWSAGVPYSFTGLWPTFTSADYTAWAALTAYTTGQRVSYASYIYQAQANNTGTTPGTDITKWLPISWIAGDNRNPQLVEMNVQIAIYKLSTRISPRNIPEIWVKNYDDCKSWLKKCAAGDVTLDAPLLMPSQGRRIRYGSVTKRINDY